MNNEKRTEHHLLTDFLMSDDPTLQKKINTFFSNDFTYLGHTRFTRSDNKGIVMNNKKIDPTHIYNFNKYGWRVSEIDNKLEVNQNEFIFAGCSQTFGLGIPEEKIWGSQIAEKYKLNYLNISAPGASVSWVIQQLFIYFKKYGHPKNLFCLFPDFYRMSFVTHADILKGNKIPKNNTRDYKNKIDFVQIQFDGIANNGSDRPKYSKTPHNIEDVIPVEFSFYTSIQMINILEQYCNSNNINLIWSTWHHNTDNFIGNIKNINKENIFNNYINIDNNMWKCWPNSELFLGIDTNYIKHFTEHNPLDCHQDIKLEYRHCFSKGTDFMNRKKANRHMGVHRHTHIAEHFMQYIKE